MHERKIDAGKGQCSKCKAYCSLLMLIKSVDVNNEDQKPIEMKFICFSLGQI